MDKWAVGWPRIKPAILASSSQDQLPYPKFCDTEQQRATLSHQPEGRGDKMERTCSLLHLSLSAELDWRLPSLKSEGCLVTRSHPSLHSFCCLVPIHSKSPCIWVRYCPGPLEKYLCHRGKEEKLKSNWSNKKKFLMPTQVSRLGCNYRPVQVWI